MRNPGFYLVLHKGAAAVARWQPSGWLFCGAVTLVHESDVQVLNESPIILTSYQERQQ